MPVTNQIPFPQVAPGSTVEVGVKLPPEGVTIHCDAELRFEGTTIDQAGHTELCSGPRSFSLPGPGTNTIDVRVFNLMSKSIDSVVTATLRDASGKAVVGPFPVPRSIPATDHQLLTILALVSGGATPATSPATPRTKPARKKRP